MKNKIQIILAIALILGAGVYIYNMRNSYLATSFRNLGSITHIAKTNPEKSATLVATAFYACDSGLTINAQFFEGKPQVAASLDEPPIPGGSVRLALSDGRQLDLPQTISADGIRYGEADDSFVFWSKGNGAVIMENNQLVEKGCISVVSDPGGLPNIYASGAFGFSFRYPVNYILKTDYQYQNLGPGKEISGVSLTIPESFKTGTNLSADSYVSVEEIPAVDNCEADLFLPAALATPSTSITDSTGREYSFASSTDAAAGNHYEEEVYAFPGSNPCVAVRYFIHYGVLENYPEGAVRAFDRQALTDKFDAILKTVTVN